MGNILFKRYLRSTQFVRNAHAQEDMERFHSSVDFFRTYSERYDFDYLMLVAQGYQESRLDQNLRSPVGAVGIMQVLPATAADPAVGIQDISQAEPNIHAGIKYMRWIIDTYFPGDFDAREKILFAFASYNAGPNRIKNLRQKAADRGLDPNVWFDNVERIAAEEIGHETVQYVSNITKYSIAYSLILDK